MMLTLTAIVDRTEIKETLQKHLTVRQLAEFAFSLGEGSRDCIGFYEELDKLLKEGEDDSR